MTREPRVGECGIALAKPAERRPGVLNFAFQLPVHAGARPHAAEVEAQDDDAGASQSAGQAIDHFIVHGAAIQRVGMTDHGAEARVAALGLFEQRLEASGGTGQSERLDAARHSQFVR